MKFPKRQRQSKGFTLTELAVVIAVIAVLIAVLVPTFISLINSANESTQQQESKNINTTLSTGSALNGTPTNIGDVIDILVADGYSEELTTNSSDTEYIWVKEDNIVVLYNFTEDRSIYPEGYDLKGKTYYYFSTNSTANSGFAYGDGKSAETAYEIATTAQLESLRKYMNSASKSTAGVYFQLDRSLELASDWTPLGGISYYDTGDGVEVYAGNVDDSFCGIFDGNGNTITISDSTELCWYSDYALFANVYGTKTNPAIIKNLNIDIHVTEDSGAFSCGGVAAYTIGESVDSVIFENIIVTGEIKAMAYGGGIVGWAACTGTFINCVNRANITTYSEQDYQIYNNENKQWEQTGYGFSMIGGIAAQAGGYCIGYESQYDYSVSFENCANYGTLTCMNYTNSTITYGTYTAIGNITGQTMTWTSCSSTAKLTFKNCISGGTIIGSSVKEQNVTYYYFEGQTENGDNTYTGSANEDKLIIGGYAGWNMTIDDNTYTYNVQTTLPNGTSN